MSIDLKCPLCGKLLRAKPELVGKQVRCPKCKYQFVLKDPDEEDTVVMFGDEAAEDEKESEGPPPGKKPPA